MNTPLARPALIAVLTLTGMGCLPPPATTTDAGAGDSGGSDGAGADMAAGVTYTKDVQPILMAKCAPCHTEQSLGNHNLATTYADAKRPNTSFDFEDCWKDPPDFMMPKTIGECALILIKAGRMPLAAGCGGVMPDNPDACLTADQIAIVEQWVAAGMPE